MEVKHVLFHSNYILSLTNGLLTSDLTRSRWSQKEFLDLHVWGCHTYVLEKSHQDGNKIPTWKPRLNRFVYIRILHKHLSTSQLILITSTWATTPQSHVIFNNWFTTIRSSHKESPNFLIQWMEQDVWIISMPICSWQWRYSKGDRQWHGWNHQVSSWRRSNWSLPRQETFNKTYICQTQRTILQTSSW